MALEEIIKQRRAYRSFEIPTPIPQEIIEKAASLAQLAPSCMNKQPWNFVFINDPNKHSEVLGTMSKGNQIWNKNSSLIVAVFSKSNLDCEIGPEKERKYYQFDTGMATAFLILYFTEQGYVAHPMAGFNPEEAKEVLKIPKDMELITLIGVGKKSDTILEELSEGQKKQELTRPTRKNLSEFMFYNEYSIQD